MKTSDSGIDFGLSDSFDQLSLKQTNLNSFDRGNKQLEPLLENANKINDDSGRESNESNQDKYNENCQPWQLYFTQNEDGDTLLHTAIIQGYIEATFSLISIAPDSSFLDILNDDAQTALHLAVMSKQPNIVRRLVLAGADLSVRNYHGNTALHLATISGDLDCVRALTDPIGIYEKSLLSRKIPNIPQNLDQRNYHGLTCLHIAASKGNLELVSLFVKLGADLDCRETLGGRTALHLALENNCLNIALFLVRECQPDLDVTTYSGYNAHQIASCIERHSNQSNESMELDDFRETIGIGVAQATA